MPQELRSKGSPIWYRTGTHGGSWIPEGDRRKAVVYTAAPLKRVEHPLMRSVREVEDVRADRAEEVHEGAVVRAVELQMDRCPETEEVEDIKEQIWLAMDWVATSKGREQPRWIVPPGTEEEHRKEALATARGLWQGEQKRCPEVEEDPRGKGQVSRGECGGEEEDK